MISIWFLNVLDKEQLHQHIITSFGIEQSIIRMFISLVFIANLFSFKVDHMQRLTFKLTHLYYK